MIIHPFRIILFFDSVTKLPELCPMTLRAYTTLFLLLTGLLFTSCKSEYEQCLEKARTLRDQLSLIENRYYIDPSPELKSEIQAIEIEIRSLAKVSGHEDLFLNELSLSSI
jgi:hypothetical protein